jgi:LPS-assembly protein
LGPRRPRAILRALSAHVASRAACLSDLTVVTSIPVRLLVLLSAFCTWSVTASAQQFRECETLKARSRDKVGDHLKLIGLVEVRCKAEAFFADTVELRDDVDQLIATGNVVFTSGGSRIAADRAEFNTKTRTGTFYNAWGTASLGAPENGEDLAQFGTQEPDVFFYGETVEKIGPKKYRVTKGGFTTCVQPEPRWQLTSSSVTVNLDEYAILRNSLFKVKGVPVLYLPLFYYPVQEDDRATGFLLPSYGTSTVRGQSLSNAFFWAISRSQDATFMHDWFGKTGQGYGTEYRYRLGGGSRGDFTSYWLREGGAEYTGDDGGTTSTPERRSYKLRGSLNQRLGPRLRAQGHVNYFSDIQVQQTYQQNIYEASRRDRTFSGSLTGNWREYSIVGKVDRSEYFYGVSESAVRGSAPSVTVRRSERPLFGSPVYFGITGDYDTLIIQRKSETTEIDRGLSRIDLSPLVRVPFTRWPFLSVNSSFAFRSTYWTESEDEEGTQIDEGISRNYYRASSQVTGPVFNRIWTFAGNRYAEKLKHAIEPFFEVERVSAIKERERLVPIDSTESVVGGMTSVEYGFTNRLYRKPPGGSASREILSAAIKQRYYTDSQAAQFDTRYVNTFRDESASKFSPLAIDITAMPTDRLTANFNAEYDTKFKSFRSLSANGRFEWSDWLRTNAEWSQNRLVGFFLEPEESATQIHYLSGQTEIRLMRNRFGGTHSFNYNIKDKNFLQQRVMLYYNAQCCGFGVEYQRFDFGGYSFAPVGQDRRFNFSFTLAGIGTFGNFFGALGGADGRGDSDVYD